MEWLGLINLILTPIFYLFSKKSKKAASTPDKTFEIPSVEVGKNLPVLFGTRMIKSPKIAWYGDLRILKVKADTAKKK